MSTWKTFFGSEDIRKIGISFREMICLECINLEKTHFDIGLIGSEKF